MPNHLAEPHILSALGAVEVMLFEFKAFDLGHLVEEVPFRGQSVECLLMRHGVLHLSAGMSLDVS